MSFDDLYNNFKIVEQQVKRTVVSSSSSGSPNMDFLSSPSSTNEVDTASIQVSAASTPVSTVCSPNNTANLSDATVYAFLANQPNGSQLVHEDLEQIHEDDLEEMDLKWQFALLSMRAKRYFQKTGKKITINGSDTAGYDKTKMVLKPVLKTMEKKIGQKEVRLVWNNAMRVNHQNFSNSRRNFAPTAVLTKSGIVPISIARQSSSRVAAPGDPQAALRSTGIFDSRCSRHMTGNKSFLSDYQEYDGGFVAFAGSSKGGIELKGYFLNDGYVDLMQHFWNTASSKTINSVKQIHVVVDGKAVVISESLVRGDLIFDDEDDKAVNQVEGDRVERDITTDASLKAAQDNDNITKTQTTTMPNVDIPHGIDTGGRPRRQETMGGTSAQTTSERVLEQTNEPPLTEGRYTPGSDEGRITLAELMETFTILSNRVTQLKTGLSTTNTVYNKAFITLTNKVKKLKSQLKQKRSKAVIHSSYEEGPSVHIEDSPKQGRIIEEMDKDENISLVSEQGEVQETVKHSRGDDDETLIETLLNIKRSSTKDKGKGIMQETELPKKLKKKEMILLSLDEELA
uniref:Ribonuclease H-like domain-containing protein n=1 Tax=Tanacetum cinerariifolium TaxID=118510 RepID=A0A6L2L5C6_TANCI|nr:ribonuclease H-like domain-containing protein [Tanacetum cinerariifolium]